MSGGNVFFRNFAKMYVNFYFMKVESVTGVLRSCILAVFAMLFVYDSAAQSLLRANRQQQFDDMIPAGNYSGITSLGNDRYAVVSDKSDTDGFYVFHISVDSITGSISDVVNEGFVGGGLPNRDAEGVAYIPDRRTVLVVGEADNKIVEYDLEGQLTGRSLVLEGGSANYGYESLAYDADAKRIWTCTENVLARDAHQADSLWNAPVLRLQCFNDSLLPVAQYAYIMDAPRKKNGALYYAHGVSELSVWNDSTLLVLEREFHVPNKKLGASVMCKLYAVKLEDVNRIGSDAVFDAGIEPLSKRLVYEWNTRLTLLNFSIANYEGMCLGPVLADGNRCLILVADSQDRKAGVLSDWFKTLVLKN